MAWLFFRLIYLPGSESPLPPNQSTCSLGDLRSPFWPSCWQSGLLLWFLCTCGLTSHLPKPTNAKSTYSAPNPKALPEENHTALQNCIASIHGLHPGLGLLSLDSSLSRTSQQLTQTLKSLFSPILTITLSRQPCLLIPENWGHLPWLLSNSYLPTQPQPSHYKLTYIHTDPFISSYLKGEISSVSKDQPWSHSSIHSPI